MPEALGLDMGKVDDVYWTRYRHQECLVFLRLPTRRVSRCCLDAGLVARTFAWLGRSRRLSKDYEGLPKIAETWIRIAMRDRMLHLPQPRLTAHICISRIPS